MAAVAVPAVDVAARAVPAAWAVPAPWTVPAGFAAAHRLLTGGARVTVLEASGRLGGKLYAGEI
ncbi:FAD-dependent oxidoreductase, partial [Streptomyces sp. NPDC000941]